MAWKRGTFACYVCGLPAKPEMGRMYEEVPGNPVVHHGPCDLALCEALRDALEKVAEQRAATIRRREADRQQMCLPATAGGVEEG